MALTQVSTGGIKDGQVHTADLADAQITAGKLHADALDHTYTLGASGTDHYTFTGEGLTGAVNDPTLYLTRGKTYRFVNGNSSGAHPFRIQSVAGAGGTEYNTGVTNNAGAGGSTIIFEVPHDAPDVLYYICTSHASMNGIFYVTGALADGTVTTAKLADDAVTDAKLANSINTAIAANTAKTSNATHTGDVTGSTSLTIADDAVTSAKIADDAVTTAKIANEAVTLAKLEHGTSSNDGKFLRANNGADPTFETVSGTTINNNNAGRVITGSGTANTLEGNTKFTFSADLVKAEKRMVIGNGTDFQISSRSNTSSYTPQLQVTGAWNDPTHGGTLALNGTSDYPLLWLNSGASFADNSGAGYIIFSIKDGAGNYCNTASIRSSVDGTPGDNDSPGDLIFSTTSDGTCNPCLLYTSDAADE